MLERFETAKAICKPHMKGFRKLKLKRPRYIAGKQGARLAPADAHQVLDELQAAGLTIEQLGTCRELATKGLFDCVTVS